MMPLGKSCVDTTLISIAMQMIHSCIPHYSQVKRMFVVLCPALLSFFKKMKNFENVLPLNDSKSDIVIMSPSGPSTSSINNLSSRLGTLSNNVWKEAHNLGVIFDSELSFNAQVTKVVQSCFAQLRQLKKIRSFLSSADLEKVTHAFISSRLADCNALYSGISRQNIQRLQLIQNAAPRFLSRTKRCDHITPILAALHWLPVSFRIDFKILLLVFKALNESGCLYLWSADSLWTWSPPEILQQGPPNGSKVSACL